LADFFGAAFFEGGAFFFADLVADLRPPNALSQPSAYFWFVPMRVIVTAFRLAGRIGFNAAARPGAPWLLFLELLLPKSVRAVKE
jgi:hypothetical protein